MTFRVPLQDLVEYNREQDWRNARVPEVDIRTSAQTGMDARDVWHLRLLSQKRWLIIVRCPKRTARPWHGILPPKTMTVKQKSGSSGTVGDCTDARGMLDSPGPRARTVEEPRPSTRHSRRSGPPDHLPPIHSLS